MPKKSDNEDTPIPRRERGAPRKSLLVRLTPELHEELRRWADHELRSLNAHIEYLLREALRRRHAGRSGRPEP